MKTIHGVKVKKLRVIPDERGRLTEILRSDDKDFFVRFGQVYLTSAYPGVVKAWHYHKEQTDTFACILGMMKIVLYDNRDDSPTKGEINEFFAGIYNPILIQIPPRVLHGFKCVSETEAMVVNIPDRVYNYEDPDEFRIPFDSPDIPYNWARKDG
jgi:dTDP-4-dehydrorhamnose 3,5-epimerase